MKIIKHLLVISAALFIVLGIPFMSTDYYKRLISGDEDSQTGASVIVEKPSGSYKVLINTEKHTDSDNLMLWHDFFEGRDVSFIFEDISCTVASNDAAALQLAESFQSRLPQNQMSIRTEDAVLMVSKADYGRFDIIIMSQELADAYSVNTGYDFIDVIDITDN